MSDIACCSAYVPLLTQSGHCIYFVWCGYRLRLSIAKSVDKAQTSGSIHGREKQKAEAPGCCRKAAIAEIAAPSIDDARCPSVGAVFTRPSSRNHLLERFTPGGAEIKAT
jgi:hypothetical protein